MVVPRKAFSARRGAVGRVAVVLVAVATVAACGTTVPVTSTVTGAGPVGSDGIAQDGTTPGAQVPGASGSTSGADTSAAMPGGVGPATGPASGVGSSGSTPAGSTPVGSGAVPGSRTPVRLGITYPDTAALASAFGQPNKDPKPSLQHLVTYLNAHGGIAGRKVLATYYKANTANDQSTEAQAACAAFTQDARVDVVINTGVLSPTLSACLRQKGVPDVDTQFVFAGDAQQAQGSPNWLFPDAMRIDRSVSALLTISSQLGRLKRGDTLGVIVEDCPWGQRIYSHIVTPLAQRMGITLKEATHKCITNLLADLGPVASAIQQAELRFASPPAATHVMAVSEAEAFVIAQFTGYASQQSYHPKYLITSDAYGFQNSQPNATVKISPDALPNMSGVGWLPLLDVGNLARPNGTDQQAAQARCKAADPGEGVTYTDSGNARYFDLNSFYNVCDAFFAIKAVLESNGVRAGIGDFTRAYVATLSGRTASSGLASGYFGVTAGHLDGAGEVRPFAYDSRRKAFAYTGGAIKVP